MAGWLSLVVAHCYQWWSVNGFVGIGMANGWLQMIVVVGTAGPI
jgi:hypothetical protein